MNASSNKSYIQHKTLIISFVDKWATTDEERKSVFNLIDVLKFLHIDKITNLELVASSSHQ